MNLRKLHNSISLAYHFIFNDPKLYELINKLDNFNLKNIIQILIHNDINNFKYNHNFNNFIDEKINLIESKNNMDFCLQIYNFLKDKPFSIFQNEIDKFITNIISKFTYYYLIGFFFDSYLEKYNKFINKLNEMNLVDSNNYLEKKEIYILLVKDFLTELFSKIVETYFSEIIELGDRILNNKDFNAMNPSSNFTQIINLLDRDMELFTEHNQKINKLLN
jgi:hypothetical protein